MFFDGGPCDVKCVNVGHPFLWIHIIIGYGSGSKPEGQDPVRGSQINLSGQNKNEEIKM